MRVLDGIHTGKVERQWCVTEVDVTRHESPIAQLVERAAVNLKVAGSNPAGRAFVVDRHAITLFKK